MCVCGSLWGKGETEMENSEQPRISYYAPILLVSILFAFLCLLFINIVDEFIPMRKELTGGLSVLVEFPRFGPARG